MLHCEKSLDAENAPMTDHEQREKGEGESEGF